MSDNYNNSSSEPGSGAATASLILGIISILAWFLGYGAIIAAVLGVAGIICASSAKKAGNTSSIRTAGFVTSLIGAIIGTVIFITCIA